MTNVTLKVQVDRTQLDSLVKEVNSLNGKTITFKTQGAEKAKKDAEEVERALRNNLQAAKQLLDQDAYRLKTQVELDAETGKAVKIIEQYQLGLGKVATITATASKATTKYSNDLQKAEKELAKQNAQLEKNILDAQSGTAATEKQAAAVAKTSQGLKYKFTPAMKEAGEVSKQSALSITGVADAFVKFTEWYLISGVVTGAIRRIREAVEEMKNVDTALVTIQRTMGATKEEVQDIGDTAYETAARLGTTASNYLNAVAEFVKAGYRDQAEGLGEMSIMLEKVGNTTSDIATQFLLAVDKAYQFEGSMVELTKVMDGVDLIGNRFATSVEKIAQGLGTVAPVAAQAHVGINELTAAIGTITAVTQRSGAEAARALRALFLNIMGDTKTEIDEGVTWTTGEIAGLRDVINMYAADVVAAADATGTLINPMEAIAALSQSMKEGVLTEQKLMEMVSDIGGKLRTSQLLALIQNFDMYQDMLNTYADAAGTAAEEYGIYLDSWEAKTQKLSATWTQLVSDIVDSEEIKTFLDAIIKLVEALDTPLGQVVLKLGLLALSATTLYKAFGFVKIAPQVMAFFMLLTSGAEGATVAIDMLTTAMLANPLFAIGAGAFAVFGLAEIIDRLNVSYKEQTEIVAKLNAEYEKQFGHGTEYADLKSRVDTLTDAERDRLNILEAQNEAMREQLRIANDVAFAKFQDEEQGAIGFNGARGRSHASIALEEIENAMAGGGTKEGLSTVIEAYREYNDTLVAFKGENRELTDDQYQVIELYEELAMTLDKLSGAVVEASNTVSGLGVKQKTAADMAVELKDEYDALAKAQDDVANYGTVTAGTLDTLHEKYSELEKYLVATENGYILSKNALQQFTQAQMASTTGADKVIDAERLKKAGYDLTTMSILQQLNAMKALYRAQFMERMVEQGYTEQTEGLDYIYRNSAEFKAALEINSAIANVEKYNATEAILSATKSTGKSGSGSGGSSSSSSTKDTKKDTKLEALKAAVTLRKSELSLMQAQGKAASEQIAKMREIQSALHEQAVYMGDIGADQAEINKLSEEWLKINDSIKKLQDELWSELEDAVNNQLKAAADARDKAIDALDKQLEKLDAAKKTTEKTLDLEQKQNDVLEARIALQNALNERTIRYYNATTGQWEWGANQANVDSARSALEKAEQALTDYQADIALEAQKQQIEARKQAINAQYDALENSWGKVTDSLQKPTREISAILNDIATNGTPQMKAAVDGIAGLLSSLGAYTNGLATNNVLPTAAGGATVHKTANSSYVYKVTTDAGRTAAQNMVAGTSWTASDGYVWTKNTDGSMVAEKNGKIYNVQVYDSGGVLSGLGGIKATRADEMILPPDLTSAMLNPRKTGMSGAIIDELRFLYGMGGGKLAGSLADNRIGTQYNGNIYRFGNVTISESQAKVMTVAELARLSRNLKAYSSAN